jgi:hypothetical protein
MSITASFPSVKKPRYVDLGEERQMTEGALQQKLAVETFL